MYEKNNSQLWYIITLYDEGALAGQTVLSLILMLVNKIPFKYAIAESVEGSQIKDILNIQGQPIAVEKLLQSLTKVKQFEWGDFFLFKEFPVNWRDNNFEYPLLIKQTDTTIRAIDNTYLDVITPYVEIFNILKSCKNVEDFFSGNLEDFVYPE